MTAKNAARQAVIAKTAATTGSGRRRMAGTGCRRSADEALWRQATATKNAARQAAAVGDGRRRVAGTGRVAVRVCRHPLHPLRPALPLPNLAIEHRPEAPILVSLTINLKLHY